jgi:5-methylcytosine-specific restriction endonuclease McrA
MKLLSRDIFRRKVWERDNYQCVVCHAEAQDAHHIIDRKLFTAKNELGGYFLDNGASLCAACHWLAEKSILSPKRIRDYAKIKIVVLPKHLLPNQEYDKWGNAI